MSLTVGELQVLLSGDPSKLNRELDRIDSRAGQTEKTHSAAWGRIGAAAGTAMKAGAALSAAAVLGVGTALASTAKIGIEYQNQLNTLGAVSGATAEQMVRVSSTAKTLGGDLTLPATSAADAAAAMTELAKGGLNVDQAMTAAKGTLQLAAAAQIDAAGAAQIQSSALNQFGLSADQASRVADVLAATANAAAGELTDVALALSYVGPVANTMGVSIEEASGAIGLLANNGLIGEKAGTALRAVMSSLSAPSKQAAAAMEDLGIQAFDAQGNFVGFSSVAGQLSDAQGRLTTEAFSSAAAIAFGNESLGAVNVLASEGAAGLDAMTAAAGRQGAAIDLSAAKSKGLGGAVEALKSQIETLQIQGFEALAPSMETVVRKATDLVPILGQRLFGAMETATGAAQKMRDQFGPELSQVADMASTKWGQFTDTVKRIGAEIGPSLPTVADALLRIAQVGVDVGTGMLPVLGVAIDAIGPVAQSAAGMLQMIAGALEAIEPILPAVVTGFLAFKGISAVNGLLGGFREGVAGVAANMSGAAINAGLFTEKMTGSAAAGERVMTTMGKASSAVSALGSALPVAGVAVALVASEMASAQKQTDSWAQAMLDGGKAAQQAMAQAAAERDKYGENWIGDMSYSVDQFFGLASSMEDAQKQAADLYDAMTPLQQAQQNVTKATNDLSYAQGEYGIHSLQANEASLRLRDAQANLEQKQRDLDGATKSATQSLLDQANQAIGLANADIGLSNATLGVQNAQANFNTVMADGAATAADRQRAENDLASSMLNGAAAAGRKAEADNAGKTPAEIHAASTKAQYDALVAFAQQAGGNVPATVRTLMDSLNAATSTGHITAAAMQDLGLKVTSIPNSKQIIIDAPTADQRARLEGLGYTVRTLPNGKVEVTAKTDVAESAIQSLLATRHMTIIADAVPGSTVRAANVQNAFRQLGGAIGGIVHPYAQGGFEPMKGGIAQVVGPNTWRVIGDRVRDDEAYIPINQDARSLSILSQTARRMGGQFVPNGAVASGATTSTGSGSVVHKHYHLSTVVREVLTTDQIMRAVRQEEAIYG